MCIESGLFHDRMVNFVDYKALYEEKVYYYSNNMISLKKNNFYIFSTNIYFFLRINLM